MAKAKTYTLVGTVKDEGPFLLEWISYYKLIGFDNIVIASNDCSDGTHEMLAYLAQEGVITHLENSEPVDGMPADPQNRAYRRIWEMPAVKQSDWVLVADADEFLNIQAGDGTLNALFAEMKASAGQDIDLISASWRVFGSSYLTTFEDTLVTAQFHRAAAMGTHKVQRYTAFKTLFRPRYANGLGIHRPRLAPRFRNERRPVVWVNGSGAPLPKSYLKQGWRFFPESYGADLVFINHYMVKSAEAFLMKRYRGTANSDNDERIDFDYFETFNANDSADATIQRHVPALRDAMARLRSGHPRLAKLHDASVSWHQRRLASAKEQMRNREPAIAKRLGI